MNTSDIDTINNKPQITWKDLLEDFIRQHELTDQMIEEQERKANEDFIDMVRTSEKNENSLPKFFFKKAINYNDLNYTVKLEAKSRFLSLKSFEIPSKKRKT